MAINILSIPAISNDPEQVFLGAYYMVLWERAKLRVNTIKILKYSKN